MEYERDYLTDLPYEIIYKTLSLLSYTDIMSYCRTSRTAASICNDAGFWMDRLDHELQYINAEARVIKPSSYIIKYKHVDERPTNMYVRWMTTLNMDVRFYTMIKEGYNDMVIWMLEKTQLTNSEQLYNFVIRMSSIFSNMELMLWFYGIGRVGYDHILMCAARNGNIDILKSTKNFSTKDIEIIIDHAVLGGQINVLNYIEPYMTEYLSSHFGFITLKDNTDTLDWVERHDTKPTNLKRRPSLIGHHTPNIAAERGLFKVLNWLKLRNIYPNNEGADNAIKNRRMDVVFWLRSNRIYPTIKGANYAAENGDMDMLKLLEGMNLIPNKCGNDGAALNGHLNVLEWMTNRQLSISERLGRGFRKHIGNKVFGGDEPIIDTLCAANFAAKNGHIHVLNWLESHGIIPDTMHSTFGAGNVDTLLWLRARGITPNQLIANNAAMDGNGDVLFWLEDMGILPNHIGANGAFNNSYPNVLLWLDQRGIFPNKYEDRWPLEYVPHHLYNSEEYCTGHLGRDGHMMGYGLCWTKTSDTPPAWLQFL